jgi:CBS domain-containing protein
MDEANLERPVRESMSTPVETIDGGETIADVATILWNQHIGALVVGTDDEIEGIVTESDVVRSVGAGLDPQTTPVREIMTEPVVTVEASAPLQRAISRMNRLTIKKLPVVEDDVLVGILTTTDVTGALAPDLGEVVEHIQ